MIENLGRKLPEPIKKHLRWVYDQWDLWFILDKKMVRNLAEYFNMSYDKAVCFLKVSDELYVNHWNQLGVKTEEERINFYKTTPYNIFTLAYWHMQRSQRRFRKEVVKHSFGDILDYGGGIGAVSIKLAEKGVNVTYADLKGQNMMFAEWLFKKGGYSNITMYVEKDQEKIWSNKYDTIICLEVIQHVLHPEVVLLKFAKHLRENGRLIITRLDCPGNLEGRPMQLRIDFDTEKLLNSLGLFKSEVYEWLWVKKKE
jgi:2-polyprenyl-3-methyl-5-hydroxy-6-metoxy-1,4-benzoquinol methylase